MISFHLLLVLDLRTSRCPAVTVTLFPRMNVNDLGRDVEFPAPQKGVNLQPLGLVLTSGYCRREASGTETVLDVPDALERYATFSCPQNRKHLHDPVLQLSHARARLDFKLRLPALPLWEVLMKCEWA